MDEESQSLRQPLINQPQDAPGRNDFLKEVLQLNAIDEGESENSENDT